MRQRVHNCGSAERMHALKALVSAKALAEMLLSASVPVRVGHGRRRTLVSLLSIVGRRLDTVNNIFLTVRSVGAYAASGEYNAMSRVESPRMPIPIALCNGVFDSEPVAYVG